MKWFFWGFVLLFVGTGCSLRPRPTVEIPLLTSRDCVAFLGEGRDFQRPIVLALTDSVIAENAPLATNEAEQLVFAQLYETLVTINCRGKMQPGLAEEWSVSGDGRQWRFQLRKNARFSDGSAVTGESVRESWDQTSRVFVGWIPVSLDSVRTQEDVVIVSLTKPLEDPLLFANPGLSVVKRSRRGWPLGTGPYLLSLDHHDRLSLIPNPSRSRTHRGRAPLLFLRRPGKDPRDVLAEAPSALLTQEKQVLSYAGRLDAYTRNLPGSRRTYYLLSGAIPENADQEKSYLENLNRLRDELSRNVVTAESVPVTDKDNHPQIIWGRASWVTTRDNVDWDRPWSLPLVFTQSDNSARNIAERLVALGAAQWDLDRPAPGDPASPLAPIYPKPSTAEGLSGGEFLTSLAWGNQWGFIVPMFGYDMELKGEAERKLRALKWFESPDSDTGTLAAAIPLVITQSRLIIRDGLVDIVSDGLGNFHFYRAGWSESALAPPESATP